MIIIHMWVFILVIIKLTSNCNINYMIYMIIFIRIPNISELDNLT